MNIFVEKPLSVKPVEEVDRLAKELKKVQDQDGVTIAVGYMLRYSPAVEASYFSLLLVRRLFMSNLFPQYQEAVCKADSLGKLLVDKGLNTSRMLKKQACRVRMWLR